MINTPPPPPLYLVTQVKCISCNHIIRLSEDADKPKEVNEEGKSDKWQIHQALQQAREENHSASHIICERCEAENDNWVRISRMPYHKLWWRHVKRHRIIWQIIGIALVTLIVSFIVFDVDRLGDSIFLSFSMLAAAIFPFWIMPQRWRQIRENNYLTKIAPKAANRFVFLAKPFLLTLGVVILIPLIVYIVIPRFAGFVQQASKPQESLVARAEKLNGQMSAEFINGLSKEQQRVAANSLTQIVKLKRELENECKAAQLPRAQENLKTLRKTGLSSPAEEAVQAAEAELAELQGLDTAACAPKRVKEAKEAVNELLLVEGFVAAEIAGVDCAVRVDRNYKDALAVAPACRDELVDKIMAELDSVEAMFNKEPLPETLSELAAMAFTYAHEMAQSNDPAIQQKVADNIASLETAVDPAKAEYDTKLQAAVIWLTLVLFVLFIAALLASGMVSHILEDADNYLPRPIFCHISSMMKAAKWDVERALQARNMQKDLEIIKVERNKAGGIDFEGILYDSRKQASEESELPRQFLAETDRWAYLTKGNIVGYVAEPPKKEKKSTEKPTASTNHPSGIRVRPFD